VLKLCLKFAFSVFLVSQRIPALARNPEKVCLFIVGMPMITGPETIIG